MNKKLLAFVLSACILLPQTHQLAFANTFEGQLDPSRTSYTSIGDETNGVTSPTFSEFKYIDVSLNRTQLLELRDRADEAYRTNEFGKKVGMVSFLAGLCGESLALASLYTGAFSQMWEAQIDPYTYYRYATLKFEKLNDYKQLKVAECHFTFKRVFINDDMTPWFPISIE